MFITEFVVENKFFVASVTVSLMQRNDIAVTYFREWEEKTRSIYHLCCRVLQKPYLHRMAIRCTCMLLHQTLGPATLVGCTVLKLLWYCVFVTVILYDVSDDPSHRL